MKKIIYFLFIILPFVATSQVGIGTTNPNPSSLLDITDTTKGVLVPRMTQAQRDAITGPATGLLIYQTNNSPGFYYFNGTIWVSFASAGWSTTGNNGTSPSINKVGTIDNQGFSLATNNTEKIRVSNTGNVGIGTNAPSTRLHIVGSSFEYLQPFTSIATGNITTSTAASLYYINNNTSCGVADGWRIENTSSANCTNCNGNRAVINYGASSCAQNATLVVQLGVINIDTVTISFDYGYDDYNTTDQFIATLYNNTTNSVVATFFNLSTADANATHSGNYTIIPGNNYSLRFQYIGTYAGGATVDNISVRSSNGLQIVDGFQANGKVLVSNATGQATWQNPTPSNTIDQDWTWNSGSTNTDPIYHVANVFIGSGATTTTRNLQAWNGTATGTIVEVGSVEYLQDGTNEIRVSDLFTPLTDASQDLGSTARRWTAVYASNGTIQTSDERLKEDIKPLEYGLEEILKLRPVSFQWKEEKADDFIIPSKEKETKLGFIAQEVLQVIPEAIVTKDWFIDGEHPENGLQEKESERLGISYSEIIPVTIKAIQEQQIKIDALKETNKKLKNLVNQIKQSHPNRK